MKPDRLAALDEVRGIALLLVFASHAANDGMLPAWLGAGSGQTGVQLFFMLSGYLMMRLYGGLPATADAALAFATARAARILPLYWTVLLLSAGASLAGLSPHYQVTDGLLPALAMVLAPQELWSIPVEAQFYALFLLLWWRAGTDPRVLAALLGASFLCAAGWRGLVTDAALLPAFLPAFLGGAWLASVQRTGGLPAWLGRRGIAWVCLALILLNLPGIRPLWGAEPWQGFFPRLWLDPLRFACALALLASAAAAPGGRWLALAPLAWVGHVSFGAYLFHRPVLRLASEVLPAGPALAAACLAVSLLVASVSLVVLERPAGRALRRALGQPRRARRSGQG